MDEKQEKRKDDPKRVADIRLLKIRIIGTSPYVPSRPMRVGGTTYYRGR